MTIIEKLIPLLPYLSLEPATIGILLEGFKSSIYFDEPPNGLDAPYICPIPATQSVLETIGMTRIQAERTAKEWYLALKPKLSSPTRVLVMDIFYDDEIQSERIDAWVWFEMLQTHNRIPQDLLDFIRDAIRTCQSKGIYFDSAHPEWRLWNNSQRPVEAPTCDWIQMCPGEPWIDDSGEFERHYHAWRTRILPIAQAITATTGEQVLYLRDLNNELDDDFLHRFLVLHWCCEVYPQSPYIQFLVEQTGAHTVEEFKSALIDPATYVKFPYQFKCRFRGLDADLRRFNYTPQNGTTVGIVCLGRAEFTTADLLCKTRLARTYTY